MTYKLKDPTLTATPIEDIVTRQLESAAPADIAVFLQEAFESGDTKHFARCVGICLLYTSPSPRDRQKSRMPSSA